MLTDEHQILLKNVYIGVYNIEYLNYNIIIFDNDIKCAYKRKENKNIIDLSKIDGVFKHKYIYVSYQIIELGYDKNTITYTLVLENEEWVNCNSIIIACVRKAD